MTIDKSEQVELLNRVNELQEKQASLQRELFNLQRQIRNLPVEEPVLFNNTNAEPLRETTIQTKPAQKSSIKKTRQLSPVQEFWKSTGIDSELEKFVGENLINKIGIAVLIIGVGIGTKYAIDNDLISPLVRIILGYLVGFGLAGFALRLKSKYLNFSAVLSSGAMAVFYFITYAAHSYYNLFPQITGITIMVAITALTVFLALQYNRQVIAHFGLVGAYIIPYLLKDPFSNVVILFVYMTILNIGILIVSAKKLWKPLNYVALAATWIIFLSWAASSNYNNRLGICITFLAVFFLIFHLVFLLYKLKIKEKFAVDDAIFLLINAAVLFITGYVSISMHETAHVFLGLFTFFNSVVYAITALFVFKINANDQKLQNWYIAFALALFTLAIPVQLGNFETAIIWSFEAVTVFLIGRYKKSMFFEISSHLIMLSLFFITVNNWTSSFYDLYRGEIQQMITPILNFQFLASLTAVISFTAIFLFSNHAKSKYINNQLTPEIFKILFPILFLLIVYFTFYTEINLYWGNRQIDKFYSLNENGVWIRTSGQTNSSLDGFRNIWLLNYTLIFALIISFINYKWIHKIAVSAFNLIFHAFIAILFLTVCIVWINELFQTHLNPPTNLAFPSNSFYVGIRYLEYALFIMLLFSLFRWIIPLLNISKLKVLFDIAVCIAIVRILSNELISWFSISGSSEIYKYGLSVLWGVLSLIAVGYGIWSRKKHLRITGIAFFGITLLKLFFYDLTNLETIPKTLVFILTGGLLLVVSYLYNKYTNKIFGEN